VVFSYDRPPKCETPFDLHGRPYRRDYVRCRGCGHFVSQHELDLSSLYSGEYMDTTYAGDRLRATYERIMALAPERSDNVQRVERIVAQLGDRGRVLDIGSGLAVFPARMTAAGWQATALDPDERAVAHAREVVGVEAVRADFMQAGDLGRFDLVSFNKVLEHVEDPVAMLSRALPHLEDGGVVYVELPDAERARLDGPEREEFCIEHLHVFSMASMCLLGTRAGMTVRAAARLTEPSTKYTLYAFLQAP
jgi:SAM-dependent methyltransferase